MGDEGAGPSPTEFAGTWYELARIPIPLGRDWVDTSDRYEDLGGGRWAVTYAGRKGSPEGPRRSMRQRLRTPDPARPREMEASFIPFLWMPYRIAWLSADRRAMLVTSSSRRFLWLMCRDPRPEAGRLESLVEAARSLGFAVERIERVPQSGRAADQDPRLTRSSRRRRWLPGPR